jgi:predicted acylesterase/phospholipase RssA
MQLMEKQHKRLIAEPRHRAIDLVESGGGLWKLSSLPAIRYCLERGARLRRLAGVSGGGLIVGLLAAGAVPHEVIASLPRVHNISFMDAFQIPIRLREVFPEILLVDNTAGRLEKEVYFACSRLDVSGMVLDVLRRISQSLRGFTFRSLIQASAEITNLFNGLRVQDTMQQVVTGAQLVVISPRTMPDISLIDAMAATCAFFVSYRLGKEDLHDGFYFSNLPTRVLLQKRQTTPILAHQTDPFLGDTWTSWFLRRIFNPETVDLLQQRFAIDEDLASQHGVLLCPRVQELSSPFSGIFSNEMLQAGEDALAANRFYVDRSLLKLYKSESAKSPK